MKLIRLVILLAASRLVATAQGVPRPSVPSPPSALERFLANNPTANVVKKQTGTLVGSNRAKAVFTAIVATSPANPSVKIKGLEIRVTDSGRIRTLYLDYEPAVPPMDEDNFQRFLDSLQTIADKPALVADFQKQHPGATRWGATAEATTHNGAVLNIGWWQTDQDIGVRIDGAMPPVIYLPGTTVSQADHAVRAARDFLVAD